MKKKNMIKSIATVAAVSAGVLFAGAQSTSANTVNNNSTVKHTVVYGDTLNKLAAQYGVSVQELAQANSIKDINMIYVGEVFNISNNGQVTVSNQSAPVAPAAQAATTTVAAQAPVQQATPAASTTVAAQAPVQQAAPKQVAAQAPVQQQAAPAAQVAAPAKVQAQAPVQQAAPKQVAAQAPVQQQAAPAAQVAAPAKVQAQAPVQQAAATPAPAASSVSSSDAAAKAWIAGRESGGSYTAQNGRYIGKYQLDSSYLNGDYSAANQEAVANNYVSSRYGSWSNAQAFWMSHNWY
ncbi:LysM peptidoglycan-binding domain-containing protein [Fructilactobacillus sp. Tb1]|uniref:aggregation-promoting factor n=1 Tax=Fructilactobacillus sp. Tb1 TaxID=3422304 RepID=UPI003D27A7F9